jgi:hypothetical protein
MTNEELLVQINAALADARAAAANANAAANTANAAANQASSGAAAGVAGARTQSNVEASQLSTNTDSDIGVTEAWSANVKRTYDVHQTYDLESMQRNRLHFDAFISEQTKHLSQLHALSLITLKDAQVASKLGDDRVWNVNETDAFATILAGKVAEELVGKAKAAA